MERKNLDDCCLLPTDDNDVINLDAVCRQKIWFEDNNNLNQKHVAFKALANIIQQEVGKLKENFREKGWRCRFKTL